MKKTLLLSVIASTMMMAGGDIAPVEEPMIIEDNGFYLGLAYSIVNTEVEGGLTFDQTGMPVPIPGYDDKFSAAMLQAGYKFNSYFALEGRYWFGLDDVNVLGLGTVDAPDAWGLYAKPMFPVTEDFDIYGLVGYADVDLNGFVDNRNTHGFSWGLGLSYEITESIAVFADYVSLVENTIEFRDVDVNTYNFGVTYNF